MNRTDQVECIIFRRKKSVFEFLLLKRIPEKGGFWQPPCGGVEQGEDLMRACYREILEETGIKKNDIVKVYSDVHEFTMGKHYLSGEDMPVITEHVFGFEVTGSVKVDMKKNIYPEHEEFRWVNFEDALVLLKWDDNKTAFKKFYRALTSR